MPKNFPQAGHKQTHHDRGVKPKGDKVLFHPGSNRQVTEGRTIAKHGRLQGGGARPSLDRSIGSRGDVTNKEQGIGRGRKNVLKKGV